MHIIPLRVYISRPGMTSTVDWALKANYLSIVCISRFSVRAVYICTARTENRARVKDPIYICLKSVGLTAGGIVTQQYCIHY